MASWLLFVVMTTSFLIPEHACSTFCFSCTDLQGSDTCEHAIKCGEGEICYTQKYKNRNDETHYSLGCTHPELCRKDSVGSIFGRSTEHSHVLCHKCCNSSVCNSELECNDNFKKPLECADIDFNNDGLYFIYPSSSHSVQVNCVIRDGIKWTVFQRRVDGSVNFNRTWNEYKYGFGNRTGEFWLGNDILYLISSNGQHKLRVEMTDEGLKYYAIYSQFLVESESNKYRLTATGYYGDAGDSLNDENTAYTHTGMEFTTRDRDNDRWSGRNCATASGAGWWYSGCFAANLNRYPCSWVDNLGDIASSMMMMTRT